MKKLIFFIGILCVLAMSSCRTDLKLAKSYVAERTGIQAAVYFPEQAEVKVEYNTQYGRQTEVLNGFSQDLFLDLAYNAYADAMQDYGVTVYVPEDIDNVPVDSVHWLVMLSRMEVSGRITEYEPRFVHLSAVTVRTISSAILTNIATSTRSIPSMWPRGSRSTTASGIPSSSVSTT